MMDRNIFISYAHSDAMYINDIVNVIQNIEGANVWYDSKIRGGEEYFGVIAEQILRNNYFVFLVSNNSVHSEWCLHELEFAMSESRKIIAVWLEDFLPPPRVRIVIQNTQYINWYAMDSDVFKSHMESALGHEHGNTIYFSKEISRDGLIGGKKYFISVEKGDYIKSLVVAEREKHFTKCFKPENAVLLGLAYELGYYVEKDDKKAEFYYSIGVYKDNKDAKYLYASLMFGRDESNSSEYIRQMNEAAVEGSVMAMVYFGEVLYKGKYGVITDKEKALDWWQAAADKNDPVAQYFMAREFRTGDTVLQDARIALMYALCSAESKFPRAYGILGLMYQNGEFVERDVQAAEKCFNDALHYGDYNALSLLGDLYFEMGNADKSYDYYKEAEHCADDERISSGMPYYNIGRCYENGYVVEKNVRTAIDYYFKGAKRENLPSRKNAVRAINKLRDSMESKERMKLLSMASELNCHEAELNLGNMYLELADHEEYDDSYRDDVISCAVVWFDKGVNKRRVECIRRMIEIHGSSSTYERIKSRETAIEYYQLLFSIVDEKEVLPVDYFNYALELDAHENGETPDRTHSLYYFKKAVDSDTGLISMAIEVVCGYLKGEKSVKKQDIDSGEELLKLINAYWDIFSSDCDDEAVFKDISDKVCDCFELLAGFYEGGEAVDKDNEKAKTYRVRAAELRNAVE